MAGTNKKTYNNRINDMPYEVDEVRWKGKTDGKRTRIDKTEGINCKFDFTKAGSRLWLSWNRLVSTWQLNAMLESLTILSSELADGYMDWER